MNTLHPYEVLQAHNGDRTLPRADEHHYQYVRQLLGYDPQTPHMVENIGDHRCATVLRKRLDLLLAVHGRPPTLQPREGCEFTLFYMVYSCLLLDPENVSQWSDRVVSLEKLPPKCYMAQVWEYKVRAYARLEQLGFSMVGKMARAAHRLLHLHMDTLKYLAFNARNRDDGYSQAIQNTEKESQACLRGLAGECYLRWILTAQDHGPKPKFLKQLMGAATWALRFDALGTCVPDEVWAEYDVKELIPPYKEFLARNEQLLVKYEHSRSMMMPITKIDRLSETKQAALVKWWKPYEEMEMEGVPALASNISLSSKHCDSVASLGKRLKKMKVTSSPETRSSSKKKAGPKKCAAMDEEGGDYTQQYYSSSFKKGLSTVDETAESMDDETLSITSMIRASSGRGD
jgi:hypothetical protein